MIRLFVYILLFSGNFFTELSIGLLDRVSKISVNLSVIINVDDHVGHLFNLVVERLFTSNWHVVIELHNRLVHVLGDYAGDIVDVDPLLSCAISSL